MRCSVTPTCLVLALMVGLTPAVVEARPLRVVETHHALDVDEVARWQDPKTVQAFAEALWAGLQAALKQ